MKPTLFTKILIVPKKYGKYEKEIRNRYMDEFLFQLNTDFKLWKKRERVPKFTHKNLKIKIVYAKNGQSYFTYNPDSGDNLLSNTVKDPVIKLFDDYQNSLSYGNLFCLNGGFFFSDKHFGKVYERLEPKLRNIRLFEEGRARSTKQTASRLFFNSFDGTCFRQLFLSFCNDCSILFAA